MRTKERAKKHGEVFTPNWLVQEMLGKLPKDTWQEGKTFLDNSCGNGNFLVAVLARKIDRGHDPLRAMESIYGTDIMRDNIDECHRRLLSVVKDRGVSITTEHCRAVLTNVLWLDLKIWPKGSLDFDFDFEQRKPGVKEIRGLLRAMKV